MHLHVDEIHIGDRVRQHLDDDIRPLCQSIDAIGQLQPILIDSNRNLLCGARRLRACQLLQRDVWAEEVSGFDDLVIRLRAEQDENTCRKPFTPSELVAMGKKIEAVEKPKAAERKKATQAKPGEGKTGGEKFTPPSKPEKTRDKVAKVLGVSGPTYDKMKTVVEAASKPDATPEVVEAAKQMDADGKVDKAFKTVKAAEQSPVVELPPQVEAMLDLEIANDGLDDMRDLMSETSRIDDAAITRFAKLVLAMDDVDLIHAACKLWVK